MQPTPVDPPAGGELPAFLDGPPAGEPAQPAAPPAQPAPPATDLPAPPLRAPRPLHFRGPARTALAVLVAYLGLLMLPQVPALLPWTGPGQALHWLVVPGQHVAAWTMQGGQWLGTHVFGFASVEARSTGSGDGAAMWSAAACRGLAALLLGCLWAALDGRGALLRRLLGPWRIALRYQLAAVLLGYGFHKLFPLQFGEMSGERLHGTYGDASPMNLLWSFLAASPAYTVFGGLMEVLPGLLLLFRRTALLGALLAIAVMTNVVLMNFCYDVPVKLMSAHWLLIAAVLAGFDLPRLWTVFCGHGALPAARLRPPMPRWLLWPLLAAKLAFAGWLVWSHAESQWHMWQQRQQPLPAAALAGVWEVVDWQVVVPPGQDGAPRPPDAAPDRWQRLALDRTATVVLADGTRRYFAPHHADGVLELRPPAPGPRAPATVPAPPAAPNLSFTATESAAPVDPAAPPEWLPRMSRNPGLFASPPPASLRLLQLEGEWAGRRVRIQLRHRPPESYLLLDRGFHWIQERPWNINR